MELEEIFKSYTEKVAPIYTYLVALKGKKPVQVLVEIENVFSHISQAVQGRNKQDNLERAKNHLERLHIDLYKLLLVEVNSLFRQNNSDSYYKFISLARIARESELESIGMNNSDEVAAKYREAINCGLEGLNLEIIPDLPK